MYKISKEFSFSMGHRLYYHEGLCKNFHGHNYKIIVGIKGGVLNDKGMLMDFSLLKFIAKEYLNKMDHALMINSNDMDMIKKMKETLPDLKVICVPYEPTAENMAKEMYLWMVSSLKPHHIQMDYITVYETDTSQATYTES